MKSGLPTKASHFNTVGDGSVTQIFYSKHISGVCRNIVSSFYKVL